MGFFDFLKPKRKSTPNAFEAMERLLFPGGDVEMKQGAEAVRQLVGNKLNLKEATVVLTKAKGRFMLQKSKDPSAVMAGIVRDGLGKLDRDDAVKVFIYAAMGRKVEDIETAETLLELMNTGFGLDAEGTSDDVIPEGYGEFGLEVTNPVPIKGIFDSPHYLGSLRTSSGARVTWQRLGSTGSANIEKPIDIYAISGPNGEDLGRIYLNPYHNKTSSKAPKGFKMSSE